jgi:hypothetical protein
MAGAAKLTIVKVRKDAKGNVTHVVYEDGKTETIGQAIKRAQKGGIANFAAATTKVGKAYLRKAKGQDKALAELPEDKPAAAPTAAKKPKRTCSR